MKNGSVFKLLIRTLKSYSKKEEIFSAFFVIIFLFSSYGLVFGGTRASDVSDSGNKLYSENVIGKIHLLNPVFVDFNRTDRDISALIFSGLSKYDPVAKNVVEDIAAHTLSVDKKTYTFTLKENTFWHDGTPVTADDIYFTYHDVIQSPELENPILKANFQSVEINKIDRKTVTFKIKEPNSFFFTLTTVGLLPSHILKDIPVNQISQHPYNLKPVGTGPFKVNDSVSQISDLETEVTLTAFENYYGKKPGIHTIRIHTYETKELLLENKDVSHGIAALSREDVSALTEKENRFNIYEYTLPQFTGVFINTDDQILKERNVRLALLKSINKQDLTDLLGSKIRIDTPLLELKQSDWLHEPNLEQAQGALFDADWKLDGSSGNKIRTNSEDQPLNLTITALKAKKDTTVAQDQLKTLAYLEQTWESIGINIEVKFLNTAEEFQEIVAKKDYQLLLHGYHLGYNFDMYTFWHSSQSSEQGLNLSNYRNLKADHLIENIRVTYDQEEKKQQLEELGKIIAEDIPAVVLYTPVYSYAIDKSIQNIEIGYPVFPSDRLTFLINSTIK